MIDHISLKVRNVGESRAFYEKALAPLGYAVQMEFPEAVGMGLPGMPSFWIVGGATEPSGLHVAFHAKERGPVDAFHAAALEAGGKDNGGPGVRAHYHPSYYASFVFDPDGNNIEAVCHAPV